MGNWHQRLGLEVTVYRNPDCVRFIFVPMQFATLPEPSQCSDDNSSEVVPGLEETVFYNANKIEENRETKVWAHIRCC